MAEEADAALLRAKVADVRARTANPAEKIREDDFIGKIGGMKVAK